MAEQLHVRESEAESASDRPFLELKTRKLVVDVFIRNIGLGLSSEMIYNLPQSDKYSSGYDQNTREWQCRMLVDGVKQNVLLSSHF